MLWTKAFWGSQYLTIEFIFYILINNGCKPKTSYGNALES